MNQDKPEVESDFFDWLPTAMTALAMYAPDGEFAGSELPLDEAGGKAIWIFHEGKFMKRHNPRTRDTNHSHQERHLHGDYN
jgi:hypothetical protein